jgi:oligoendopeptidase F
MAQMGAFELYERSLTNKKQAWADYYALCCSGGSKPYFDTLKVGNISNPFAPDTVKKVTAGIIARLLSAKY